MKTAVLRKGRADSKVICAAAHQERHVCLMKIKTKQIITGIAANVLFLPPIFFTFIHRGLRPEWKLVLISFLPLIFVLLVLRIIWGPDYIRKSIWKEEGFSSFKEWFKNSQTLNAKFFRFNLKFALPGLMILSILSGVIIGILK